MSGKDGIAWQDFYHEPYEGKEDEERVFIDCSRCGGQGYFPYTIDNGRCWQCYGGRGYWGTVGEVRLKEKARAQRVATKHRKAKRAEEAAQQVLGSNPELTEAMDWGLKEGILFIESIHGNLFTYGEVTTKQQEAVLRVYREHLAEVERKASEPEPEIVRAPEGRVEVTGTIKSIKYQENYFSYHGGSVKKMLVETDDGWKTFGTCPASLGEVNKGDRVKFTATIKPSEEDPEFSFLTRPTKAVIL